MSNKINHLQNFNRQLFPSFPSPTGPRLEAAENRFSASPTQEDLNRAVSGFEPSASYPPPKRQPSENRSEACDLRVRQTKKGTRIDADEFDEKAGGTGEHKVRRKDDAGREWRALCGRAGF